jgi:hypothetical protein
MQDGRCGDACRIRVGMLAGVAAELLKFFRVPKQLVDPSCERTGLLYPVTCMPCVPTWDNSVQDIQG